MTLSASDRVGALGEVFVADWALRSGHLFIKADGKTPSIDGQLQLFDPQTGTHLYLQCQVKSGLSHVRDLKHDARHVTLSVKRADVENWRRSNVPVVLIWVNNEAGKTPYALWADVTSARPHRSSIRLRTSAVLDDRSAGKMLELARAHAGRDSVLELSTSPAYDLAALKRQMWLFFVGWREAGAQSPIWGRVQISRHLWRHITRSELSAAAVAHRISLLPCAREVVASATVYRFLRLLKTIRGIRFEFVSIRGRVSSSFRRPILVEVIVQIAKRRKRVLASRVYSVHEVIKENA